MNCNWIFREVSGGLLHNPVETKIDSDRYQKKRGCSRLLRQPRFFSLINLRYKYSELRFPYWFLALISESKTCL